MAVPRAVEDAFTYALRERDPVPQPGTRVLVPFGQETLTGVVLELLDEPDVPDDVLRSVSEVLDDAPILGPELLRLGRFIADYYVCPLGEVLRAMHGGGPQARLVAAITADGEMALAGPARGSSQHAVLATLSRDGPLPLTTIARRAGVKNVRRLVSDMRERGWIELAERFSRRTEPSTRPAWRIESTLADLDEERVTQAVGSSPVRREALEALERALERARAQAADRRDGREGDDAAMTLPELAGATGRSTSSLRGALNRLAEAGLVVASERVIERRPEGLVAGVAPSDHVLSDAQGEALAEIDAMTRREDFSVLVLEGVTGSGKTEVYLRALREVVDRGGTGLYLVPEISITPLLLREVRRRFGDRTAVLHSGLSAGERHDERRRIAAGDVDVVVGARSAVFAPLPRLALILVDEEHDASYKQDSQPRYHGRDVAVVRGTIERCPVVLGSATPSLETYRNALEGRYALKRLPERVGGARRATVEIVDMRTEWRAAQGSSFSRRLRESLDETLSAGRQAMVLLNRRGWAEFLLCRECGEPERCDDCSVTLTVHLHEGKLTCHYCGAWRGTPARCRSCAGTFLQNVGKGTEQVEEELVKLLPGVAVARLDADVMRRKGAAERLLASFEAGRTHVLLGTQVIAKGHDFANVTLVGVLQADRSLWMPDFRAAERTFQLLVQVAGRAGRRRERGRVVVQTHAPEHPAMTLVERQDHPAFYEAEASLRRATGYPPFTSLVALLLSGEEQADVEAAAARLGEALREALGDGGRVLGPAAAPIARIKKRHRVQLMLKGRDRRRLGAAVRKARDAQPMPSSVTLDVDVDPQSLL